MTEIYEAEEAAESPPSITAPDVKYNAIEIKPIS